MTEREFLQLALTVVLLGGLAIFLHVTRRHVLMLVFILAVVAGSVYYFTVAHSVLEYIRLGLDLRGGTRMVLQAYDTPEVAVTEEGLRAALGVIRERVDRLGVSEPNIYRVTDQPRIVVELAGVTEREALDIVSIANLEFRRHDGRVVVTGKDLRNAQAALSQANEPMVLLEFTPEGKRKFSEATTEVFNTPGCPGSAAPECRIDIYLDQDLVQSPVVQSPAIEDAQITGYANLQEAQRVATILNIGALPLHMQVEEVREISATLGQESVARSRVAVIIGLTAVVAYMLAYYRLLGLVASFALVVYMLLFLATLAGINAVLTLPGVAGIVLSLGMAVDANVIIFERIREELRTGKTFRAAMESGFIRGFTAILDGNVTTLIAAAVLFKFGTGPIRGFAVTLSIGVLASMVTAILFTRYLLRLLVRARLVRPGPLLGTGAAVPGRARS